MENSAQKNVLFISTGIVVPPVGDLPKDASFETASQRLEVVSSLISVLSEMFTDCDLVVHPDKNSTPERWAPLLANLSNVRVLTSKDSPLKWLESSTCFVHDGSTLLSRAADHKVPVVSVASLLQLPIALESFNSPDGLFYSPTTVEELMRNITSCVTRQPVKKKELPEQWIELKIQSAAEIPQHPAVARHGRFANYRVQYRETIFYCLDIAALHTSLKDVFEQKIYDFEASSPAPLVVDGGGHIGIFSVYAKQKFPNARVIVFEPDQKHCEIIRLNLNANGCADGVEIVQAGLHDHVGKCGFVSKSTDGSHISVATNDNNSIDVVALSAYFTSKVDFLKLNIEGTELEVLKELGEKLKNVDQLVIEYHGFPELGQRLHSLLEILAQHGFRYLVHDFDTHTNPATKPPFRVDQSTKFYLLVYGRRILQAAVTQPVESLPISVEPKSRVFGLDLGTSICRVYIDQFLKKYSDCIQGRVLEIGEPTYTNKFGIAPVESYVISQDTKHPNAIKGDLVTGENIPKNFFDCIILTQTIQVIFDIQKAVSTAISALRPGGILLITASGISQISRYDMERWGEYWRVTDKCMQRLLETGAPAGSTVRAEALGNLATAQAYLQGRPAESIPPELFAHQDNDYQLLVGGMIKLPRN